MPEANSIPVSSNPVGPYPGHDPGANQKPKLLDRLREALRSRHSFATIPASLTVPRPGFAAPSMDFGMKQEDLILIRIRCRDKKQQGMQVTDIGGIIAEMVALSGACYKDRKPICRILCGSI
jgi:hypothetical protein